MPTTYEPLTINVRNVDALTLWMEFRHEAEKRAPITLCDLADGSDQPLRSRKHGGTVSESNVGNPTDDAPIATTTGATWPRRRP